MIKKLKCYFSIAAFLLLCSAPSFATTAVTTPPTTTPQVASETSESLHVESPVAERAEEEDKIQPNYFSIGFYKPTYILPYYYTVTPDNAVYEGNTPDDEQLKHAEFKYQLSFKVPLWKDIFNSSYSFYLAYTQKSYWQVYNESAFFRETDYEPELFVSKEMNYPLIKNWAINFFNVGAVHQSNGYGGDLERSWNRIYLEAVTSVGNWMISVRPWYVINDALTNDNNPDIADYLGHGQFIVGYKYNRQVFALTTYSILQHEARRASAELTWSFPLTSNLKGYVQVFSGYGQSLIEYNHRTNSAGIGIALSDWV